MGVVEEEVNKVVTVVDRHRPDVLKCKQGQVGEQATHTHILTHSGRDGCPGSNSVTEGSHSTSRMCILSLRYDLPIFQVQI